jgi:hypothetical protein
MHLVEMFDGIRKNYLAPKSNIRGHTTCTVPDPGIGICEIQLGLDDRESLEWYAGHTIISIMLCQGEFVLPNPL